MRILPPSLLAVSLLCVSGAVPRLAHACGGFACSLAQPVVQTGERIVYFPHPESGSIDVIIDIQYQGPSEEFAWLLPLPGVPLETWVGSPGVFSRFETATAPQVSVTRTLGPQCRESFGFNAESDSVATAGAAEGANRGGVTVHVQDQVGPYERAVISSDKVTDVEAWLLDNGYDIPGGMLGLVHPYLQKGDVLLALRLKKDSSVGEIQPIHLRLPSTEACIPLTLTAVAAVQDMDVFATIVTPQGRAIPQNYYEVEPNWLKLDWLANGSNYQQLVGEAVDEATGHAFVTESAMKNPPQLENSLQVSFDTSALNGATGIATVLDRLGRAGLAGEPGVGAILVANAVEPALQSRLAELGDSFLGCPTCFSGTLRGLGSLNPKYVDELRERIVEPLSRTAALYADANRADEAWVTRLHTVLSPEEMTLDPIFDYRNDLPEVSNVLRANVTQHCSFGGGLSGKVTIEAEVAGQTFTIQSESGLDALPSAMRARSLASAEISTLFDNRDAITSELSADGCRCARPRAQPSLLAFGLVGLGFFALRRRRR